MNALHSSVSDLVRLWGPLLSGFFFLSFRKVFVCVCVCLRMDNEDVLSLIVEHLSDDSLMVATGVNTSWTRAAQSEVAQRLELDYLGNLPIVSYKNANTWTIVRRLYQSTYGPVPLRLPYYCAKCGDTVSELGSCRTCLSKRTSCSSVSSFPYARVLLGPTVALVVSVTIARLVRVRPPRSV